MVLERTDSRKDVVSGTLVRVLQLEVAQGIENQRVLS